MDSRNPVKYKDSGVEWIGDIPEHWEVNRFKELFHKTHTGWTPDTKNRDSYEGDNVWITIGDMKKPCISESAHKLSDKAIRDAGIAITPKGSLLFSFKLSIGKIAFADSNLYTNEAIISIEDTRKVNLNYFYYALPVLLVLDAKENIYGAKLLNQGLIFNTRLLYPPMSEQKIIANYLDTKITQIDRKIEMLSQKSEKYDMLKQSLINETVTRGLDKAVSMKDSGLEWIGEAPAHWEITRNKDIFEERGSLSISGDETLLTVSHITGVTRRTEKNVNMFMAETMEGYKHCRSGDLIINTMWAWMGALGTANEDGICSPAYGVYKPKKNQPYNHRYFDYLYRTPNAITEMTRNSKGIVSSRLRLYPKDFFQMLTALPPKTEQEAIADYLDEKILKINQIIEAVNSQLGNLKELRKTLINDVVTGKVKVV